MALQINKNIRFQGVELDSFYCRLECKLNKTGNKLIVYLFYYANKTLFDENNDSYCSTVLLNNIRLNSKLMFNYNRANDGNDLLLLAHNKLISEYFTLTRYEGEMPFKYCEGDEVGIVNL